MSTDIAKMSKILWSNRRKLQSSFHVHTPNNCPSSTYVKLENTDAPNIKTIKIEETVELNNSSSRSVTLESLNLPDQKWIGDNNAKILPKAESNWSSNDSSGGKIQWSNRRKLQSSFHVHTPNNCPSSTYVKLENTDAPNIKTIKIEETVELNNSSSRSVTSESLDLPDQKSKRIKLEETAEQNNSSSRSIKSENLDLPDQKWVVGNNATLLHKALYDKHWLPESGSRVTGQNASNDDIMGKAENDYVHRKSLHTLRPGTWLNDEVVHYVCTLLRLRDEKLSLETTGRRRSHFFKSFFLTKLLDDDNTYNYANVKNWSKKVPGTDIFALDKVIFVVNIGGVHWGCAVAYIQLKKIQYYDSLHGDGNRYLEGIFRYLQDEHLEKKQVELPNKVNWKLVPCQADCPSQQNNYDCGVFVCAYADHLSVEKELGFGQDYVSAMRQRIALSVIIGHIPVV